MVTADKLMLTVDKLKMALSLSIVILHLKNYKLHRFYLSNYLGKITPAHAQGQFQVFRLGLANCLNDPLLILN